jgi:hypothetical protein
MPPQLHRSISSALCPMRARGLDRSHRMAAKLHVSRSTRQLAPVPSQGGSAGSNPVGATIRPAPAGSASVGGRGAPLRRPDDLVEGAQQPQPAQEPIPSCSWASGPASTPTSASWRTSQHPRRPHADNGALTSGGAAQQRRGSTQEVHSLEHHRRRARQQPGPAGAAQRLGGPPQHRPERNMSNGSARRVTGVVAAAMIVALAIWARTPARR